MDYEHTIIINEDTSYKEGGWINKDLKEYLDERTNTN